ncbi:MAG: pH regulation protein F [Desulfobacterales bacterium]|nr:pH regulation protein F [Desulfobacterales bacterium]
MESFFLAIGLILGLLILLSLYRGVFGPTLFDRIIGVGFVGSKTLVLLVLMGFMYGRIDMFVDISLAYSILIFIGTLVFAKYFKSKGAM